MIIWIMGLSGSGKTTLAKLILKKYKKKLIHIDGDAIRNIYDKKIGHSQKDRQINAARISKLVKTKNRFKGMKCKPVILPNHENIDIDEYIKDEKIKSPIDLYNFSLSGHFNNKGYTLISKKIINELRKK